MAEKRTKGRPRRSSGDAGRDMLIAAARQMFKRPHLELNRKELAVVAGVTPALVSYYFRDQVSLLEAVARPVLETYARFLHEIVSGPHDVEHKFRSIVSLLLRMSFSDGRLIDDYIDFLTHSDQLVGNFPAAAIQREFHEFFQQCEDAFYFKVADRGFAQTLLWGACKAAAQTSRFGTRTCDEAMTDPAMEQELARMIVDLFVNGLAKPPARPGGLVDGYPHAVPPQTGG